VHASTLPGSGYALFCVLAGVFVTALYSFRMYFLVFHGEERFGQAHHAEDEDHGEHHGLEPGQKPHESPLVVTIPLVLLAIPSVVAGWFTLEPLLFGGWFGGAIESSAHLEETTPLAMALHGFLGAPFWLALAGVVVAWALYMRRPDLPARIRAKFAALYTLLDNKYYFDRFNDVVVAAGARLLGEGLWKQGDRNLIDGVAVTGSTRLATLAGRVLGLFQTGYLYQYAFTMIAGLVVLLTFWIFLA